MTREVERSVDHSESSTAWIWRNIYGQPVSVAEEIDLNAISEGNHQALLDTFAERHERLLAAGVAP